MAFFKNHKMERRLRKERLRTRLLTNAVHQWSICRRGEEMEPYHMRYYGNTYRRETNCSDEEKDKFISDVEDEIFNILKSRYERQLEQKVISVSEIDLWFDSGLDNVSLRLFPYLQSWRNIYTEKVVKKGQDSELLLLAKDSQNIHTKVVNKQTNMSIQLIEQVIVPKSQRTMDEILTTWLSLDKSGAELTKVYNDMLSFVNKGRNDKQDLLYRRILRGLWAKIKTFDDSIKRELSLRLWEECQESVEMCYDGHVSRLTNVLVGFDEAYKTPISIMESFQNSMSMISTSGLTYTQKIEEATKAMDAASIPVDERAAWLEAF